jgi:hypothetical protein
MLREGGVSEPRAKQERGMKIPNNDLDAARLSPSDREAIEAVAIADILSWALAEADARSSPSNIRIGAVHTARLATFWATRRVGDITIATIEDYRRLRLDSMLRPREKRRANVDAELLYLQLQIRRFCREHELGRKTFIRHDAGAQLLGRQPSTASCARRTQGSGRSTSSKRLPAI